MRMPVEVLRKVSEMCPDDEMREALGLKEYVGHDSAREAKTRKPKPVLRPAFIPVDRPDQADYIIIDTSTGFYDHG